MLFPDERWSRTQLERHDVGIPGLGWYGQDDVETVRAQAATAYDNYLASFAPAGQLSLLHLGQQGYAAGNQILTKAVVNPIMPALAELAAGNVWPDFERLTWRRLAAVLVLASAAWIALALAGRVVLSAVLGRWLDPAEIALLHVIMVALGGVWLGGAAGQVSTVSFFALGDTTTPTKVGVVGFTVAIPIKIVFYWWWGVAGLAAATSLCIAGNAVGHQILLHRAIGRHVAAAADRVPA